MEGREVQWVRREKEGEKGEGGVSEIQQNRKHAL